MARLQDPRQLLARYRAQNRARAVQPVIRPEDYPGPEFDIQRRALSRAYDPNTGYEAEDIATARRRAGEQLGLTTSDLNRQRSEGLFDFQRSQTRGTEDYGSAISNLQRNYSILGGRQREAANAAGVIRGGTLRAAAKKRAENMSVERKPIDTSHTRFLEDIDTDRTRFGQGIDRSLAEAARQYGYETEDLGTRERRSGREYADSVADLDRQAVYATQQAGLVPPAPSTKLTATQRAALERRRRLQRRR
ncbi:MAG: hypothetical protein C4558_02465 [Dehalococcoidia bacterium]|nr:MAG: hypothetical protein C4558_02465 [Dehalococcoidia bacterium]